jgi:hypothetical protein
MNNYKTKSVPVYPSYRKRQRWKGVMKKVCLKLNKECKRSGVTSMGKKFNGNNTMGCLTPKLRDTPNYSRNDALSRSRESQEFIGNSE